MFENKYIGVTMITVKKLTFLHNKILNHYLTEASMTSYFIYISRKLFLNRGNI